MLTKERITKTSTYDSDNFIAKTFCRWVLPFCRLCLSDKKVEIEDLFKCSAEDETDVVVEQLERNWCYQQKQVKPNFFKALQQTFATSLVKAFIFFALEDCVIRTTQPILLGIIVRYFSETNCDNSENFLYICLAACALCLSTVMIVNFQHPAYSVANRVSMRAKVAWNAIIYKKCLRLSRSSLSSTTTGHIINLMTNDSKRFDEFAIVCSYLLIVPIQTIIFLCIAWKYLGSSCLATFAGLMLFIPLISWIGTKVTKIRSKISLLTDYRVCLTNEIIRGIRVIKMYGWEQYFQKIAHEARRQEVEQIKMASTVTAMTLSVSFISARLVLFLSIITFVLRGGHLNAETVFVTIALFERLRYSMTWMFPQAVSGAAELRVSCKRMQNFLSLDEIKSIERPRTDSKTNFRGISMKRMCSRIKSSEKKKSNFLLKNISFDVKCGESLAVVGPVGSGKSSLLLSVMGELDDVSADSLVVNGSVAYVSQKAFCFNGTIRENILFGKAFNQKLYHKILYVCALEEDLKHMSAGDQTLVGERGITLSGGQRARINLARSLYLNSDIYLLDDPLSAVDASVAKHIFENAILDFLGDKCVVLVTNQMQFLQKSSKILCLRSGKCLAFGNFETLMNSGIDFVSILGDQNKDSVNETKEFEASSTSSASEERKHYNQSYNSNTPVVKGFDTEDDNENNKEIDIKVYFNYFKSSSGWPLIGFALLSAVVTQTLYHLTDYWLTFWDAKQSDSDNTSDENRKNIIIYTLMSCGLFIFATIRSVAFFQICLQSSHAFHNLVLDRLLRTSMTVFDFMPIGRILNRFTRDIGVLDDVVPLKLFDLNLALVQLIGLIFVVITSNYYFIIPGLLFASVLIKIRRIYVKPSQVMRKFESITRSPIYSHISTTVEGLTTIRAFGAQELFFRQYSAYQNDHTSTWFLQYNTARVFGIALDYIGFIYISIIVTLLLMFRSDTSERSAGLAFSSLLGITSLAQWAVKRTVDVDVSMNSLLRLKQYLNLPEEEVESEETEKKKKKYFRIPKEWPKSGQIIIRNLSMTYPNSEQLILNDINVKILNGQKIGIVGRTGSGKTSLINALFRLVKTEGNITIDGINVKNICLRDLRKNISIIPQEPTVFNASIRSNLDPFEEYSDYDIWTALEEVQLRSLVQSLPNGLNTFISEQALNLSVGQRQLICLCRALLRKNRILILDEATANVDHKTDFLIQKAIRSKFKDCTVITVAHRLETVIDCHRILVIEEGRVVDDNSPYLLLKEKNSYFSKLVKETGHSMASRLHDWALKSFNKNSSHFLNNTKTESVLRQRNI